MRRGSNGARFPGRRYQHHLQTTPCSFAAPLRM
jgi:hypothetical protein